MAERMKEQFAGRDSAELYDPASGTFASTGGLTTVGFVRTATLLKDGRVLITGESDDSSVRIAAADLYDPVRGTFSPTGAMSQAPDAYTATSLPDGRVLIVGGRAGDEVLATAELFD